MRAGSGVDQLPRYAHSARSFSYAAFKHVTYAKLATDLLHVNGVPLVCEARVAGDDEQRLEMGQCGDDVIGHAVGEIILLRIGAQVDEWQNSNGGFVGEREDG